MDESLVGIVNMYKEFGETTQVYKLLLGCLNLLGFKRNPLIVNGL